MGLGRFFEALQQVQAVAQIRKARRSDPSLQNLGQDPLALRVISLLSDDVSMLPSPSDFETLLVSVTQRADELEKDSMLRGLTLWKTWAHASMEGGGFAAMDEGGPGPALHRKHGSTRSDNFRPHTHHR